MVYDVPKSLKTFFVSLKFKSNWLAYVIISKSGNFN